MKYLFIFFLVHSSLLYANISREIELLQSLSLEELMEVEISTGTNKLLRDAPSAVSIITSEEIERMGARTLSDVLETIPGVHVYPSNTVLPNSNYSIRGIHTTMNPQVLLLVDSQRLAFMNTGGRIHGLKLPVSNIKRIEVIRGPGSALYGADAFSGVINIVTQKAEDIAGFEVGAEFGSFNRRQNWLKLGSINDNYVASFYLNIMHSGNDKNRVVHSDIQSIFDGIFATSASNAPTYLRTDYDIINFNGELKKGKLTLGTWGFISDKMGVGSGVADAIDESGALNNRQIMLRLKYETNFSNFKNSNTLSYIYNRIKHYFTIFPNGTVLPIGSDGNVDFVSPVNMVQFPDGYIGNPHGREKILNGQSSLLYDGYANHKVRLFGGFSYTDNHAQSSQNFGPGVIDGTKLIVDGTLTDTTYTSGIYIDDITRRILFAGVQDEYKISDNFELTYGVRYDHYDKIGSTFNPRVALVWNMQKDLTAKFLYGRAFRAPSFQELYYKNNPTTLGNKNLEPETINTFEIVLEHQSTPTWHNSLNIYHYKASDLIEFQPSPTESSEIIAQNHGKQEGDGIEYQSRYIFNSSLDFLLNYSYTHAKDKKGYVVDVPKHQAYAQVNWDILKNVKFNSQIFHIGSKDRAVTDSRAKTPSYTIVNGTFRYSFDKINADTSLSIYNLFDKKYVMPAAEGTIAQDYPMSGRSFSVQFQYKF